MARDTGPRLLLGRPCYHDELRENPSCTELVWTHERYSDTVVASMTAALRSYLSAHPHPAVVLVGYSGGGTLAWLMASRVPETVRVVTVAANLDTDAWARGHGYSLLAGSLNPALAPALAPSIRQLHLVGERDTNVPPAVVRSFARAHADARVVEVPGYDHRCCWLEIWPRPVSDAADAEVGAALRPASRDGPAAAAQSRR